MELENSRAMDELIAQVRQLGMTLAANVAEFDLGPVFEKLSHAAGPKKGRLLDLIDGSSVVINSNHPMASKLADGKPGRAQVLASAIISLVNRAEKDLTDHHQRHLHRYLLESMVSST
ncbi:MAG: hypothetical protein KF760_03510 [Candidatus Eremiobacteraeota bacterium]|nr:hypothetical protein [Candidatus Eremiobacteraeota bacterium]